MRPVLDENGKETGSYNINPDPDGEPGSDTEEITPEVQKRLDAIPDYKPKNNLAKAQAELPRAVNHVNELSFVPFSDSGRVLSRQVEWICLHLGSQYTDRCTGAGKSMHVLLSL
jgi:hypothetical protein